MLYADWNNALNSFFSFNHYHNPMRHMLVVHSFDTHGKRKPENLSSGSKYKHSQAMVRNETSCDSKAHVFNLLLYFFQVKTTFRPIMKIRRDIETDRNIYTHTHRKSFSVCLSLCLFSLPSGMLV
jgi:hypothetical protein